MSLKTKKSNNDEENMNNLDIYIECLKDVVEKFKKKENPSNSQKEEVN